MTPPREASPLEILRAGLKTCAPPCREPALRAAIASALGGSGRLVRGLLAFRTAQAAGLDPNDALRLGCAVEYWHQASLILDDLPSMDDARLRRGLPCLHRMHGEAVAQLTALALINRAYTLCGEVFSEQPRVVRREALRQIDFVLGPSGLLGGQSRDLHYQPGQAGLREPGRIAWQKTGLLLQLAVTLPALTGTRPEEMRDLRAVSVYWGLGYQLLDDLADLTASAGYGGKDAGQDARHDRPNAVTRLGPDAAKARLARLFRLADARLSALQRGDRRWAYLHDWQQNVFAGVRANLRAA